MADFGKVKSWKNFGSKRWVAGGFSGGHGYASRYADDMGPIGWFLINFLSRKRFQN